MSWRRGSLAATLIGLALVLLLTPAEASAASCDFQGPGAGWQTPGNWSCMHVPTASDDVTLGALGAGDNVSLTGSAEAASLSLNSLSVLDMAPGATLAVAGAMSATSGTVTGDGELTVSGPFTKTSSGQLTVRQGSDLVLAADSSVTGGSVCLQDLGGGEPAMRLDARLTIGPSAASDAFNCSNGDDDAPHLIVSASGELIKTGAGLTRVLTAMDNDGLVRADSGHLQLFGTAGVASDGSYVAEAGAKVEFHATSHVGSLGRVGGPGTTRISADLTLAAGATLDPAALELAGQTLELQGTQPLSLPQVSVTGGTLKSTRDLLLSALDVTAGTLRGNASTTIPTGGSFSKTTSGQLTIRDGADLVLDVDAALAGGSICLQDLGGGDPSLQLNERLTIEAAAKQDAFNCNNGADIPHLFVNPGGELLKTGPGVKAVRTPMENEGEVRAEEGTLQVFGTAGAASGGAYLAGSGATIEFNAATLVAPSGRVGGAGTARVSAGVTLQPGATLDPQALTLATQTLTLEGSDAMTVPWLRLAGGTLNSTRAVIAPSLDVTSGTLSGNGSVSVPAGGSFSKTTAGQLTVRDGTDLILDEDSALSEGSICLQDLGGGDPSLQLNTRLTIEATAGEDAFNCSNGADIPHLFVNPGGELVKAGPGVTRVRTPMDNDGEVRAEQGILQSYGTANASSGGTYLAAAGATLEFASASSVGATGRVGGGGTARVSANATLADGATLDPHALELAGQVLTLGGSAPVTVPALKLVGGTLNSTRNVAATSLSAESGTLSGDFVTTVPADGSFDKATVGRLTVRQGADLVLNSDSSLSGGSICLQDLGAGDPSVQVNARLTIAAGADLEAFNCTNGADVPHLFVAPSGELVKTGAGVSRIRSPMKNDGEVRVEDGTLQSFGTAGAASDGAYLAGAGATLEFSGRASVGATGRVGGPGVTRVSANLTLAPSAALNPAVLELAGQTMTLQGTGALSVPSLSLVGGVLDSSRDLNVTALSAETGTLVGNFTTTVPASGSFSKTTAGQLTVKQGADLVLNVDASLSGGSICLQDLGGGDPGLHLNAVLTIADTASENAFNCSNGDDDAPHLLINSGGELRRAGPGLTRVQSRTRNAGTVAIAGGRTLHFVGGYEQVGGLTDVAAGAELIGPVSLLGGVLAGNGQLTGQVSNPGGSVRAGASAGVLKIQGSYNQGAGGTLQTEVAGTGGGTDYDRLVVTGGATLGGTLQIIHTPDFAPAPGDPYQVVSAGNRSGTFASVTGTELAASFLVVGYNGVGVTLSRAPDPPQNTSAPAITGTPVEGQTLTCNPGAWSGSPTFGYTWVRNGAPVPGVTVHTYSLGPADVGSQLACRVTATNAGGTGQASSSPIVVGAKPPAPQPPSSGTSGKPPTSTSSPTTSAQDPGAATPPDLGGCLDISGRARGNRLGPVRLGRTRTAQRAVFGVEAVVHTAGGLDSYCTVGGGSIAVGYRGKRHAVLVLTTSRRFSVRRVKPGMRAKLGRRRLGPARRILMGVDVWHFARRGRVVQLLRTRRGKVVEVGIADARMTGTLARTKRFLQSW